MLGSNSCASSSGRPCPSHIRFIMGVLSRPDLCPVNSWKRSQGRMQSCNRASHDLEMSIPDIHPPIPHINPHALRGLRKQQPAFPSVDMRLREPTVQTHILHVILYLIVLVTTRFRNSTTPSHDPKTWLLPLHRTKRTRHFRNGQSVHSYTNRSSPQFSTQTQR